MSNPTYIEDATYRDGYRHGRLDVLLYRKGLDTGRFSNIEMYRLGYIDGCLEPAKWG